MSAPKPSALDALRALLADVRMGAERRREVNDALDAVAADLAARDLVATEAAVADVCASAWSLGYAAASRDAGDAAQSALSSLASALRGGVLDARRADRGRRLSAPPSPLREALDNAMRDGVAIAETATEQARKDPDR